MITNGPPTTSSKQMLQEPGIVVPFGWSMASVELATGMGKVQHHGRRIGPNSPELSSMEQATSGKPGSY